MSNNKIEKQYLILLICVFAGFSILYSYVVPFNAAPDEVAHFSYIEYIADNYTLPNSSLVEGSLLPSTLSAYAGRSIFRRTGFAPEKNVKISYEFHQPPLYYLLSAPIFILGQKIIPEKSYILVRIFSTLLGVATLFCIYKISTILFQKDIYLRLGPPTLVASIPMFVYVSSIINNDTLANFLGAMIIFLVLKILKTTSVQLDGKMYILSALIIGGSILSKVSIYPLAFILTMVLFLRSYRDHRMFKKFIIFTVIPVLIISCLWFGRNYINQGNILAWQNISIFSPEQVAVLNLYTINHWVGSLFQSFFGVFGWMNLYLSSEIYLIFKITTLIAFIGFVSFLTTKWKEIDVYKRRVFWLLFFALFSVLLGVLKFNLNFYQPQGRYLFPVISVFALFFVCGWYELLPKRLLKGVAISGFLGMIFINILSLILLARHFL